jgi:hypothetical protein
MVVPQLCRFPRLTTVAARLNFGPIGGAVHDVDSAAVCLPAVADRLLVNIQPDVIDICP